MNPLLDIINRKQDSIRCSWTHLVSFPQRPTSTGSLGNQGAMGQFGIQGTFGIQGGFGTHGPIGTQGYTGEFPVTVKDGKKYKTQTVPRTAMPKVLEFTFEFLNGDALYTEFLSTLYHQYSTNTPNMVTITATAPFALPNSRSRRLKEEFFAVLDEKKSAFEKKKQQIRVLIELAESLGAVLEEGYYVSERDLTMPAECYEEYGSPKYTTGKVHVLCSSSSHIYKMLDSAGLLQKYCPESYRRGDAYSVNGGPMYVQPIEEVLIE